MKRLWALGLQASFLVAAIDALLRNRVILISLLIIGPCCVALTGRWAPTALTGLWVIGLAVALGLPDGIWGTAIFSSGSARWPWLPLPPRQPRLSSRPSDPSACAEAPVCGPAQ